MCTDVQRFALWPGRLLRHPRPFLSGKSFPPAFARGQHAGIFRQRDFQNVRGVIFQEWSVELYGEEPQGFIGKSEGICGIGNICTENDFRK